MNEKLKELYYQDDVIIGSKQNFIYLAKQKLKASTKEINEFLKNQEINQVNKKPTKHTNLKITAPPRTFQLDIMYYPVGTSFKNILLIVDIQSRKAWAYVISSTSCENILNAYKKFESEVDIINAIVISLKKLMIHISKTLIKFQIILLKFFQAKEKLKWTFLFKSVALFMTLLSCACSNFISISLISILTALTLCIVRWTQIQHT
jgi:hypothetical protein